MTEKVLVGRFTQISANQTKGVGKATFEYPIAEQDFALAHLGGWPNPEAPTFCAIVPLKDYEENAVDAPPSASRETGARRVNSSTAPVSRIPGPFAREIAMLCNDYSFQEFIKVRYPHEWNLMNDGTLAERVAEIIRKECGVKSRSDICHGPTGDAWMAIHETYMDWFEDWVKEQENDPEAA